MQAQMENQKMMLPQYDPRRGPMMMRYNSIDNGLLSSPNPYIYMNLVPSQYQHSQNLVQVHHPQWQPPLLPLPITRPQHSSLPMRTSSGRLARKPKRHDQSGNQLRSNMKKEGASLKQVESKKGVSSTDHVSKKESGEDQRVFCDLRFMTESPHPSSLPLPKFFMRQGAAKLSCKAEAKSGGGASTDDLRRVLQLP